MASDFFIPISFADELNRDSVWNVRKRKDGNAHLMRVSPRRKQEWTDRECWRVIGGGRTAALPVGWRLAFAQQLGARQTLRRR